MTVWWTARDNFTAILWTTQGVDDISMNVVYRPMILSAWDIIDWDATHTHHWYLVPEDFSV